MELIVCVWQWSTSAWCVTWYVTKRQTTSLSTLPGLPRPTVTSDEVKSKHWYLLLYILFNIYSPPLCLSLFLWFILSLSGRAGRVSTGFCYRLVTRTFWNDEIPEYTIPEMLVWALLHKLLAPLGVDKATLLSRSDYQTIVLVLFWVVYTQYSTDTRVCVCVCTQHSPLANTILKVKLLDMGDPCSLLSTALTPPNLDDIERTILQLKEVRDHSPPYDLHVPTELSQTLQHTVQCVWERKSVLPIMHCVNNKNKKATSRGDVTLCDVLSRG